MNYLVMLKPAAWLVVSALALAGCTIPQQVSASADLQRQTVRNVVGTRLIGVQGATPADQDSIDDTVAGVCGAKVYTPSECARHTKETQGD